jgi:hypothetical protein
LVIVNTVLEAPAVVSGFDDIAVMCEAIEKRDRHFGVCEDAWPFAKGEIGGDDDPALVKPADEMEQELAAGLGSLAMLSWYLIERACFSLISSVSRSPMIHWGSCWRLTAVAMTSSKASFMP